MCLPAAAAIPLLIGSTVVSAAGQIYSGASARAQGRYEQAVAQQNRNMEIVARNDAADRGRVEQQRVWRRVAQQYGEQVARQGASGLDVNFGSPAALLGDVQRIGAEDALTTAQNTAKEIRGYEINAANYTMQGRAARSRGNAAFTAGLIGAAGTVLGGATQVSRARAFRGAS